MSAARRSRRSRGAARASELRALYDQLTSPRAWSNWRFVALAAFLLLVFAMAGSVRPDIASLTVVRPVSALVLGLGCTTLRADHWRAFRGLFVFALALTALVAVQLLPLPPGLFAALPGRGMIVAIDHALGGDPPWRPLAMAPSLGRNALWALLPPWAVLVLGVQLTAVERERLMLVVLAAGFASAAVGIGQILGPVHGPLFFYDDTHFGMPVGLFANRNHQAVLLAAMLPMLAVWARHGVRARKSDSDSRRLRRRVLAFGAGLLLIALILMTGSRSGMMVTVLACLAVPLVMRAPRRPGGGVQAVPLLGAMTARLGRIAPVLALIAVAGLVAASVWSGRAEAVNRLVNADPVEDMRLRVLPTLGTMARTYWLTGSGAGSFNPVYRVFEPDAVLAPTIMNAAHDDWIEVVITTGLPGVALLVVACGWWLGQARRLLPLGPDGPSLRHGRVGLAVIALFALASLTDYPLRTPSLTCLLVLAALWSAAATATVPLSDR